MGDPWPIVVIVSDSALPTSLPAPERGYGHGPGGAAAGHMGGAFSGNMHAAMQPGLSFVSQVRLHDGMLVTFDARQPAHTTDWPYRMLLSLTVLLAAVVAVSLLAVRWATRPLKALADAADELGQNIHRPPMEESGPVEVARAARAFNTMQARLAACRIAGRPTASAEVHSGSGRNGGDGRGDSGLSARRRQRRSLASRASGSRPAA